jgi:hypothetical protein
VHSRANTGRSKLVVEHEPHAAVLIERDLARAALVVLRHEALAVLVDEDARMSFGRVERQRHRAHAHADRRAARAHAHADAAAVVALGARAEARLAQRGRVLPDHLAVVHEAASTQHDAALRAVVVRRAGLCGVHADDTARLVHDEAFA